MTRQQGSDDARDAGVLFRLAGLCGGRDPAARELGSRAGMSRWEIGDGRTSSRVEYLWETLTEDWRSGSSLRPKQPTCAQRCVGARKTQTEISSALGVYSCSLPSSRPSESWSRCPPQSPYLPRQPAPGRFGLAFLAFLAVSFFSPSCCSSASSQPLPIDFLP